MTQSPLSMKDEIAHGLILATAKKGKMPFEDVIQVAKDLDRPIGEIIGAVKLAGIEIPDMPSEEDVKSLKEKDAKESKPARPRKSARVEADDVSVILSDVTAAPVSGILRDRILKGLEHKTVLQKEDIILGVNDFCVIRQSTLSKERKAITEWVVWLEDQIKRRDLVIEKLNAKVKKAS